MENYEFNLPPLENLVSSTKGSPSNPTGYQLQLGEQDCPLLRRKEGDGRIMAIGGKVTCEKYSVRTKKNSIYSSCEIMKEACPYSDLPGYDEI